MNTQILKFILLVSTTLLLFACGNNEKQFVVKGIISDADTLTLFLEKRGHADLTVIDSVKLDKDGDFQFEAKALPYAEFYRLRVADQIINFSIDSTETIEIKGSRPTLATKYSVEGSHNSSQIKEATLSQLKLSADIKRLREKYNAKSITDQQYLDSINFSIDSYKTKARDMILDNYKGTAAYFTLFQKVDDMLIFDPSDKQDLNLFRAVATVWDTYYSGTPRTVQLKNYTLTAVANMKALANQQAAIDKIVSNPGTDNSDFFTIKLPNISNKEISTNDLKGKVVILDFTAYSTEYSLAHNMRLNQVYEKYKSNIEIYQVSFDNDRHGWANAAVNLPWICVRDNQSLQSPLLAKFNIQGLPTTYLVDKEGSIIKRIELKDNLAAEVAKVL